MTELESLGSVAEAIRPIQYGVMFVWVLSAWAFFMFSPFLIHEIWRSCRKREPFNFRGARCWCPVAIGALVISSVLFAVQFLLLMLHKFLCFADGL